MSYEPLPLNATFPHRSSGNPTISLGSAGSWNASDCTATHIVRDVPNNRWALSFSGWQTSTGPAKQAFAYSSDLLTWTQDPGNPILTPRAGDGNVLGNGSPVWVASLGKFRMTIENSATAGFFLMEATSLSGPWTFLNSGNAVIVPTPTTFDAGGIFDHETRLAADGVTFEMLYVGQTVSGANRGFGRATSSDNGMTWTKTGLLFDNTSVPGLPTGAGNFDLTAPTKFVDSNGTHLIFQAAPFNGQSGHYAIGHAISRDGLTGWGVSWPIFTPTGGTFESVSVSNPSVLVLGSKVFLFYCGASLPGGASGLNDQPCMSVIDLTTVLGAGT